MKLNQVKNVTTFAETEFIPIILSDGSIGKISRTNLESIVEPKCITTTSLISSITIDDIYKNFNSGIRLFIITNRDDITNGLLMHIQRVAKGNDTTSQFIYQKHFSNSGIIKERIGKGAGEKIIYTNWKEV